MAHRRDDDIVCMVNWRDAFLVKHWHARTRYACLCVSKHTSCIEMKREKKRKRNGLNTNARAVCTRRNELAKTASTKIVLMVAVVVWFVWFCSNTQLTHNCCLVSVRLSFSTFCAVNQWTRLYSVHGILLLFSLPIPAVDRFYRLDRFFWE